MKEFKDNIKGCSDLQNKCDNDKLCSGTATADRMCTHSRYNGFCSNCTAELNKRGDDEKYPAEYCGVCYDGCAEGKRPHSFEYDKLFQCQMTAGGMPFTNISNVTTKTIHQVERCVSTSCHYFE